MTSSSLVRSFASTARSTASATQHTQQALHSRQAIDQYLSQPTWTSSQLLQAHTIAPASSTSTATKPPVATSALVAKLLKQSGLMPVLPNSVEEQAIIRDLEGQLVFVNHICEVETNGIEPLIRLGDVRLSLGFDDLLEEETAAGKHGEEGKERWTPTDLSSEKNGPYYVLKEGLRRE